MNLGIGWAADTPELFSATLGSGWEGLKHHLVVEALPNGGWDWLAWASDGSGRCLHGTSDTRVGGMQAAERAVALLTRSRQPVNVQVCRVLN